MNLLGVKPSYKTGFAQWPGMSEYPQLWEGLVAGYAPFLGMTGSKLIDWSGNGNNGVEQQDSIWTPGKFGPVRYFSGDDYIIVNNSPSLNLAGNMTIHVAVNPAVANLSDETVICAKGAYNYLLYFATSDDNTPAFYVTGLSDALVVATSQIPVNETSSITGVYDGTNLSIYINGILSKADASTGTPTVNANNFAIGANYLGSYFIPQTKIELVMIYNRALIAAEIKLHHDIMKRYAA